MEFETNNGKKLETFAAGFGVKVRFVGGGELPSQLAGIYTTYAFAEDAIRQYLSQQKYKPVLNKEDYAREDKSIFEEEKVQPKKKVANAK